MENGKIRVYGCGGAGVNVVSGYVGSEPEQGFAEILPGLIDSSKSNLNFKLRDKDASLDDDSLVYLLPEVDGSGKIRSNNAGLIRNCIPDILLALPPETINLVVFSGAGGSGSVIGPLLVSELMARGKTVVSVVIGSSESAITCTNTINTLKSIDLVSKKNDYPAVMSYHHNSDSSTRKAVDADVDQAIVALALLASKSNHELDTEDLFTWANYQLSSDVPAQVAELVITNELEKLTKIKNVVSLASVLTEEDSTIPSLGSDYSTYGYSASDKVLDTHFAITHNTVSGIVKQLEESKAKYDEVKSSRDTARINIADDKDAQAGDDLVL